MGSPSGTFPVLQDAARQVSADLEHRHDVESAKVRLELAGLVARLEKTDPAAPGRRELVDDIFRLIRRGRELLG